MLTVREILSFDVEENISARVDLEDLAFSALEYEVSNAKLAALMDLTMVVPGFTSCPN